MKKNLFKALLLTLVCGSTFALGTMINAEDKSTTDTGMPSPEEAMAMWIAYSTPGEEHENLEYFEGIWTGETKMWEPGSDPVESEASLIGETIFDGRYIETHFESDWQGMPFTGRSIMGFDNKLEVYHSYWIDNMGTGGMTQTGTYDEDTKMLSLSGDMVCPLCDDLVPMRTEYEFTSEDTYEMRLYQTRDGKENKFYQGNFTRIDLDDE